MLRWGRIMNRFKEMIVRVGVSSEWHKSIHGWSPQEFTVIRSPQPWRALIGMVRIYHALSGSTCCHIWLQQGCFWWMGPENLPHSKDREALFQEAFGHENKGRCISASQLCNCLSGLSIWQIGRYAYCFSLNVRTVCVHSLTIFFPAIDYILWRSLS